MPTCEVVITWNSVVGSSHKDLCGEPAPNVAYVNDVLTHVCPAHLAELG